ncbi:hypothetical protein HK102_005324 [Quaeritorhiza haematococci]|nr:hypothetical protein HK102_005324 [Quaeritorhiza haematococci]
MRTSLILAIAPFALAFLGSQPTTAEPVPGYYGKYSFEKTYEQCLKTCYASKEKKYRRRCFYQCEALKKAAHRNYGYWGGKYGHYDGKYDGKYYGYGHGFVGKYHGKYYDGKYYDGKYDGKY